jgi:hypothetical protein
MRGSIRRTLIWIVLCRGCIREGGRETGTAGSEGVSEGESVGP